MKCHCGEFFIRQSGDILRGNTRSCGCLTGKSRRYSQHQESDYGTRLYRIWNTMKQRCNNPNRDCYHNYGGRGISVCQEWQNSFAVFKEWAMNHGYSKELTLDRNDVNGNYEPSNCSWESRTTQIRNRRVLKENKVGCTGVTWDNSRDKWRVNIMNNGKWYQLGRHDSLLDAIEARRRGEVEHWGEEHQDFDEIITTLEEEGRI